MEMQMSEWFIWPFLLTSQNPSARSHHACKRALVAAPERLLSAVSVPLAAYAEASAA